MRISNCWTLVCRKFAGLLEPRVVYSLYHISFLCLVYFLPLLTLILTYTRVISIIKRFRFHTKLTQPGTFSRRENVMKEDQTESVNVLGSSVSKVNRCAACSTLIGGGMSRLGSHWSRACPVMLAPAILCHKEPARAKAKYTHWGVSCLLLAGCRW